MDYILEYADEWLLDGIYTKAGGLIGAEPLGRDSLVRQCLSLYVLVYIAIVSFYFLTAGFIYKFGYDHDLMKHPKFLPNQVSREIKTSFKALPVITLLTVPFFLGEIHGYSQLYENVDEYGWAYLVLSALMFIIFTDFGIYWVHRLEHHPLVYAKCHKLHHKWIVSTPFASHAFHPIDGWAQSLPYHIAVYVFPLHKLLYLGLFSFVNVWSIMIHDGEYVSRNPVVNGSAHHTVHHLYFNYNYGQFTTLFDRMFGSYRLPTAEIYDKSRRQSKKFLMKQAQEVDEMIKSIEKDEQKFKRQ
ncbi:c-5 sterol desaturase [Spiromyces aspiralis]|uniref:C-5 sterol desaturase n=1 Tax=Spiromyces aspiralis TaxID=68401 RepID=A0ACC1HHJ4_9FUNG|nr:c-5 sterol desaturase [Spiromyces aspiralis]